MYRVLEATVAYATLICTFYYYYYYYYEKALNNVLQINNVMYYAILYTHLYSTSDALFQNHVEN